MLAGVAFSLSRGGVLALVGAAAVCLLIRLGPGRRVSSFGAVALALALAAGLLVWFGFGAVEARWATVWKGQALQEGRLPVWQRVLPTARDFPVWGSGYGTFPYVEPLSREPGDAPEIVNDHAHNDYLEMLLEGGAVGAAMALTAVGLVLWRGRRAVAHCGPAAGGLALGAVFAFAAAALHAAGDFGMHVPAIVVLLTVIAAQVTALPEDAALAGGEAGGPREFRLGLWGLAPLAGAAAAAALGFLLYSEGWKAERVERFRLAALRCQAAPGEENRARQIRYLEEAVRLAPEDAVMQAALGRACEAALEEKRQRIDQTKYVLVVADVGGGGPSAAAVTAAAAASVWAEGEKRESESRSGTEALRHYLRARDLCPLLVEPQLRLATGSALLERADPPRVYLDRALALLPCDAAIWYAAGRRDLADGRPEAAWLRWRRSLECSDRYLPEILEGGASRLSSAELADKVFPESPAALAAAARRLELQPRADAGPFWSKALALLDAQPRPLGADDLYCKASAHRALGQAEEALAAYRAALDERPDEPGWRYEFAELLHRQGRLQEARRELNAVLSGRPGDARARELHQTVLQEIAEGD
jgi:tetratricopeptide (TPR) repeat protein